MQGMFSAGTISARSYPNSSGPVTCIPQAAILFANINTNFPNNSCLPDVTRDGGSCTVFSGTISFEAVSTRAISTARLPAYCKPPMVNTARAWLQAYCKPPMVNTARAWLPAYCKPPMVNTAQAWLPAYCKPPMVNTARAWLPAYCIPHGNFQQLRPGYLHTVCQCN